MFHSGFNMKDFLWKMWVMMFYLGTEGNIEIVGFFF